MKKLLVGLTIIVVLLLSTSGCASRGIHSPKNDDIGHVDGEICRESGFSYKIITIEGKRFIVYETAYNHIALVPLDYCSDNHD